MRALETHRFDGGGGEPPAVDWRSVCGKHHVGSPFEDGDLLRHGSGLLAEVWLGDNVEDEFPGRGDLDSVGPQRAEPPANAKIGRECTGDEPHVCRRHGAKPNASDVRRTGYTMRYFPASVKVLDVPDNAGWQIWLARGKDSAGNTYQPAPR
jgi:hypothetical protein